MKVKLDENIGTRGRDLLESAGFDVATAADEALLSAADAKVLEACVNEGRCLVTLDGHFSNPVQYPPRHYTGVIVIRLRGRMRLGLLEDALRMVIEASKKWDVRGQLWIAEVDGVRQYEARGE